VAHQANKSMIFTFFCIGLLRQRDKSRAQPLFGVVTCLIYSITIPVFKKGQKTIPDNYRGITASSKPLLGLC